MKYEVIRVHGSLVDLANAVNRSGGVPQGGPFYVGDTREWCQAVLVKPANPEGVRLQEPRAKR